MNHAAIRYAVGSLVALLALFMLIPLLFAVAAGEKTVAAFAVPAGVALALGLLLRRGRSTGELGVHEAMVIVSVGWTCAAVAGAFPFMLSGTLPDPVDALFEAVSGITTTGATTFPDVERLPRSILLWRALLNWLGGLGIVVLFVSLLPRPGIGGVQLMKAEMPGMTAEKLRPRIRETGRLLWGLYLALTLLLFTLLWAVGIPLFDAVVHALATVSTGGVSTRNASIAAFGNPWAEVLITFFMLLGATHFGLLYRFVRRGEAGPLLKNREFQTMLGVIGVATALIAWDLWRTGGAPFAAAWRLALFQAVAVVSTTGFAAADYTTWTPAAVAVLTALMFTSGMAGSTSGGPKMIRIAIAVKHGVFAVRRLLHPRAISPMRLGELTVTDQLAAAAGGFLFLYLSVFAVSLVILSFAELDQVTTGSMVIASLGNIGPGLGAVGPNASYGFLPAWVKLYLSFLMLVGRLEIYSVLVLFLPSFWARK